MDKLAETGSKLRRITGVCHESLERLVPRLLLIGANLEN